MTEWAWLVLKLEGPLIAFGGVAIDHVGVTRNFPSSSMITGILSNALGYDRQEWSKHQELQNRIVYAARNERSDKFDLCVDVQNVQLSASEKSWTTWGVPEGRRSGKLDSPHRRIRQYLADACFTVCLRLSPEDDMLNLEKLLTAIDRPSRPLFIGRKNCLPSAPLSSGETIIAPNAYEALRHISTLPGIESLNALWPAEEGPVEGDNIHRVFEIDDLRNWYTGLHGGTRTVVEGRIVPHKGM